MSEMSIRESFRREVRKKEYEAAEKHEAVLQENANNVREYFRQEALRKPAIAIREENKLNMFKAVLTECVSDLYISSLVIDEPQKYEKSLRESAAEEVGGLMSNCKTTKEIFTLFENAAPYVQEAMILAETISKKALREDGEDVDQIPKEKLLSDDDRKMIEDFEKTEGKDDIAKEVQDRVVEVYKAEEDAAQERREQAQNIIDKIADKEGSLNESAVVSGVDAFSAVPTSLFHAIFMNRSKLALNESVGNTFDTEQIIGETICVYTLLECINGLGMTNLTPIDKKNMIEELHLGR